MHALTLTLRDCQFTLACTRDRRYVTLPGKSRHVQPVRKNVLLVLRNSLWEKKNPSVSFFTKWSYIVFSGFFYVSPDAICANFCNHHEKAGSSINFDHILNINVAFIPQEVSSCSASLLNLLN